ncbi:DUF1289 domain-containing protein [Agrobacterium tumefaciens]|uniref:DUF1289 domain-containing protein n=1 Tax=Agrobacterium tumefaciens TaxID=358 RepID=UPI00287D3175|nr:DUF1289 domain-containing protein [Agrobacterium tumefaciens]MDS7597360.1 DUF1289 domain-containing protein [Agrobacterium tumefaciens]
METPCRHICLLDATGQLCVGCGRTLAEIGGWASYSDAERDAVMSALPTRLAALETIATEENGTA